MEDFSPGGIGNAVIGSGTTVLGNPGDSGDSAPPAAARKKFEKAEMPSYDTIAFSPEDGLYHCQEDECKGRAGFQQKCLFRYILRPQ